MEISELMAPQILGGRIALVTGAGQGNGKAIAKLDELVAYSKSLQTAQ